MKYKKILVPVDGSEFADMAEKRVLKVGTEVGSDVVIVSVSENNKSLGLRYKAAATAASDATVEESEKNIDHAKEVASECPDVTPEYLVRKGGPGKTILKTAESEGVDLIIIGSSGKSSANKLVMGSVAEKVVSNVKCDVLVIHKVV